MQLPKRSKSQVVAVIAALAMVGLLPEAPAAPAREAGPPQDYRKVARLSRPIYKKTVLQEFEVPMEDGVNLYVEVTMPDPKKNGKRKWPVVMEVSPYHGTIADRDGTRIFPYPKSKDGSSVGLTGYFAPRGYAVAVVDLRGTGRSEGCLDHLGPNDAQDLKTVIEWAAKQKWSTGKVGLTGHSYVGSTPSIAAGQRPKGLATIAPSAGLTSMYDHQFQYGVPYNLQWAGPMFAYEQLAVERHLPGGDNFGNGMEYFACGAPNSSLTAGHGQVTGQYQQWHAERDHRKEATKAKIPIFIIHGVNDNAARIPAAEWFFGRRFNRPGDKVWLGQWDHGSGGSSCVEGHPNCRFEQWQYALHAWFDRHLQGRKVDTGPPVEVFLNDDEVWTSRSWSKPKRKTHVWADATDMSLKFKSPSEDGSASFTAAGTQTSGVEFRSAPFKTDQLFVGLPDLDLALSVANSQVLHVVTTLYREDARGNLHPMNFCAIQPQLRDDIASPAPIIPLEVMELDPQCFTMAHRVDKGERLVLRVGTSSPHHVSFAAADAEVTVHTGEAATAYHLPTVPRPKIYKDVPHDRPGG